MEGVRVAKYRKVETRIWNDKKFRTLSDAGKLCFFFVLTHPHMTALGAMRATMGGMSEELGWPPKAFREAFAEAFRKGLVKHDPEACFIWLPNFLRYNRPESPNVVRSWGSAVDMLPECELKDQLLQQVKAFAEGLPEAFTKALPEAFRKSMPNQEQEQEQEQEQDKDNTPPTAESFPEQDRSLDEQRAATWQPDVEVLLLAAWEAADGRIRYPHAELTPGRRRMLLELSASPAWDWRAALEKFPLRCTQGRRDGWRPSIGWFLKEDSVDSILEGAYDWSPDSPGAKDRMAALEQYGSDDEEVVEVRNYSEGQP